MVEVTTIHTPPVLEDTAAIAYTRQRATLTLANMTIAIHITDTSAPDELVYVFADHASTGSAQALGSASILADESGAPIPNSAARYYPLRQAQGRLFGDWRTEPTADETSRWYTGHVHDNLSRNDLGLIYMNARFYLPGVARFLSADTLVPDPTNPQQFNRYTYSLNNPIRFTDPTGHCAENGDEACWSFLESQFCLDGLCPGGDWRRWIIAGGNSNWTIDELIDIRSSLLGVRSYFSDQGLNWMDGLGDFRFERHSRGEAVLPSNRYIQHVSKLNETDRIQIADDLWQREPEDVLLRLFHEIGHSVDGNSGRRLQESYHGLGERLYEEPFDDPQFLTPYLREYGRSGPPGEAWADGFAASVFANHFGSPVPNRYYPDNLGNQPGYRIDFYRVYSAVRVILITNFGP